MSALPDFYPELVERIRARLVVQPSGCWEWPGASTTKGYGRIAHKKRLYSPHRVMLETSLGHALPRDIDTCHRCDVPRCCNPAHLFAGTRYDNAIDAVRKGRMSCPPPKRALSDEQVLELRAAYSRGESVRALGRLFGLEKSSAHRAAIGETYRDVANDNARLATPARGAKPVRSRARVGDYRSPQQLAALGEDDDDD